MVLPSASIPDKPFISQSTEMSYYSARWPSSFFWGGRLVSMYLPSEVSYRYAKEADFKKFTSSIIITKEQGNLGIDLCLRCQTKTLMKQPVEMREGKLILHPLQESVIETNREARLYIFSLQNQETKETVLSQHKKPGSEIIFESTDSIITKEEQDLQDVVEKVMVSNGAVVTLRCVLPKKEDPLHTLAFYEMIAKVSAVVLL